MIRKKTVLLLVLGMLFLPILSVMSYMMHHWDIEWIIVDSDGNVCTTFTECKGSIFHDHIGSNGDPFHIIDYKPASTDVCN